MRRCFVNSSASKSRSDQDPNLSEHWSITLTADDDDAAAAADDDELYDRNSEPKRVSSQGWERGEGG